MQLHDLHFSPSRLYFFEIQTNLRKAKEVSAMIKNIHEKFDRLDVVINNAGKFIHKDLTLITEEEWHDVIDTNLTSAFLCCRAVGPYMFKQKKGKVINISSTNAQKGRTDIISYNVSKAGLSMFTRCLALEWAPFNINVNAIGPGDFYTKLAAPIHEDPKLRARMMAHIPLGRTGDVHEIGLLAVYLASPASDYITGQTVFIDGGELAFSP